MSRSDQLRELESALHQRREQIRRALRGELAALHESRSGQFGDEGDGASTASRDDVTLSLAREEARELADVEAALRRLQDGTYGSCALTGQPIPIDRLRALPYAQLCVEAQRQLEGEGLLDQWLEGTLDVDAWRANWNAA